MDALTIKAFSAAVTASPMTLNLLAVDCEIKEMVECDVAFGNVCFSASSYQTMAELLAA